MLDTLFSEGVVGVQDELRISGRGGHLLTLRYEFRDQVLAIVDARVGGDPYFAVQAERLMLMLGLPGGPEHRMTEADITGFSFDPRALRVGTAEGQMISHRFE